MLQNCSILKVAKVFFDQPSKQHYLMEISSRSKLAHTSVKKHLESLKKQNIITETIEKKGSRNFPLFQANYNSRKYKAKKRINNLISLTESGLIDFIKDGLMPKAIVLFGSYQRGEDIEDSDVDIYLECEKEDLDINRFTKKLNRRIQLHFKADFKKYPKELKNNIVNGIVLEGYLEAY